MYRCDQCGRLTLKTKDGCQRCGYPFPPDLLVTHITWWIKQKVAVTTCKVKGHDWESTDHGTPDTGYMGVTCRRCGESHGQRLY